jgi:hypothetical protein
VIEELTEYGGYKVGQHVSTPDGDGVVRGFEENEYNKNELWILITYDAGGSDGWTARRLREYQDNSSSPTRRILI